MEIMKGFAEKFQQYSIDEAFLVPGPDIKSFEGAALCALRIKDEIKRQLPALRYFEWVIYNPYLHVDLLYANSEQIDYENQFQARCLSL